MSTWNMANPNQDVSIKPPQILKIFVWKKNVKYLSSKFYIDCMLNDHILDYWIK